MGRGTAKRAVKAAGKTSLHLRLDFGDERSIGPGKIRLLELINETGSISAAGRALALIHGRDYLLPSDVQTVALDVMGHRLGLTFDAVADNIDPRAVIESILATVPPPQPVWRDGAEGTGRPEFV